MTAATNYTFNIFNITLSPSFISQLLYLFSPTRKLQLVLGAAYLMMI